MYDECESCGTEAAADGAILGECPDCHMVLCGDCACLCDVDEGELL